MAVFDRVFYCSLDTTSTCVVVSVCISNFELDLNVKRNLFSFTKACTTMYSFVFVEMTTAVHFCKMPRPH